MYKWIACLVMTCMSHFGYAYVYDCFLFFNELDILDIRLQELYDHVDRFVLVESVETFRGNPKPLFYQENRERYKQFEDKIIHVVLQERMSTTNPWDREAFQRNQIMRGLQNCSPDDVVIISDVDEIIRGSVVPKIIYELQDNRKQAVVCEQTMYRFYLNVLDFSAHWAGTCATTFHYLSKTSPENLRIGRNGHVSGQYTLLYPCIANAGWHFTSIGGLEAHIKKTISFSHQEYDCAGYKTQQYIQQFISQFCKIVPLDNTFPTYILENQEYFRDKGYFYESQLVKKPPRRHCIFRPKRPF